MFLSAYKKESLMNKSQKSHNINNNSISIPNKIINEKYSNEIIQNPKKKKSSSNIPLDKFYNKTKKGIKFGLLEYKRINEIKNFDICNGKIFIHFHSI